MCSSTKSPVVDYNNAVQYMPVKKQMSTVFFQFSPCMRVNQNPQDVLSIY